ncbi:MAG: insulinase family protein [Rhodobacteraceae bacterium]|nr:insulinase family protein [Paracoccaceae bacterium]
MIKRLALLLTILGLTVSTAKAQMASDQTSPNGIRYNLISMPNEDRVVIRVAWATDWAFREGVNPAVPYVGAQLLLASGAEGYSAGEIGEVFADLNADGQVGATIDYVLGRLSFDKENPGEIITIANTHLRAPLLSENWLERIKTGLKQQQNEANALPTQQGFAALRSAVIGDQPLLESLSLSRDEFFDNITRDDVVAWHKEVFTENPFAIVIVGNLTAEEAGNAIDSLLAGLPQGMREPQRDVSLNYAPRRILLHIPDAETSQLTFIAPFPSTREGVAADEFMDLMIAGALGGGDQSALFNAVRTELRASYGFAAGVSGYARDNRFLVLTGEVDTAHLSEAVDVVREAYAAFLQNGPSGNLDDYKAPLLQSIADLPESIDGLSLSALFALLDHHAALDVTQLAEQLDQVTKAGILSRLATVYPKKDAFVVFAVSPDKTALPEACVITAPEEAQNCP